MQGENRLAIGSKGRYHIRGDESRINATWYSPSAPTIDAATEKIFMEHVEMGKGRIVQSR